MARQIEFLNTLNTIRSWFQNLNTAVRTYTFPDKDIIVAGTDDISSSSVGSKLYLASNFT